MNRVFADTSYFIAVIAPTDALHVRAQTWSARPLHLVTTAWVMVELAAYLAEPPNRILFSKLLNSLRASSLVEFVPASPELFEQGVELYASRSDKSWSLVDCISCAVMHREGLTAALTADRHFTQMGFNALLAENV